MPEMILNRNFVLRTTLGHTVAFRKGEKTGVPKEVAKMALEIGAELVDENDREALLPQEEVSAEVPQGDDRDTVIINAFARLIDENDRDSFNASGVPKPSAIEKLVGFKVDAGERTRLWNEWNASKAGL